MPPNPTALLPPKTLGLSRLDVMQIISIEFILIPGPARTIVTRIMILATPDIKSVHVYVLTHPQFVPIWMALRPMKQHVNVVPPIVRPPLDYFVHLLKTSVILYPVV